MSPFAQGSRDAGAAAGRAVFANLKRQWAGVVAELDVLVESRATMRGAGSRILAEAQAAALDGLAEEFDRLFAEWAGYGVRTDNLSERDAPEMVPAE